MNRLFTRGYATRPIPRPKDPLASASDVARLTPQVTFIHRPPPTAESPISYTTAPASPLLRSSKPSQSAVLPPLLRSRDDQSAAYHLSASQIAQIKQLRASDPKKNSVLKLAEQFQCSRLFVSMVAPLKNEEKLALEQAAEGNRARWGEAKRLNREITKKRRSMW